jgi:predicted lipid-binding transport protein (Tim44 family)
MMPMPMPQDNMMLMMLGSLIGHLVFGIVLALIVPVYIGTQSNKYIQTAHT